MDAQAATPNPASRFSTWVPVACFFAIAIGGLFYVKWSPYYAKVFLTAQHHTLGASILSGSQSAPPAPGWHAGLVYSVQYIKAIWQALVLGLALGAGVDALLPRSRLIRLFTGRAASMRATALAVPSMMCTCCSAPIAVGLLESGASPASALIYWLANPVLNPAVLIFIGFVLGWEWAALRLVAGVALVFVVGSLAARFAAPGWRPPTVPEREAAADGSFLAAWMRSFFRLAIRLVPEYAVLVFALGMARAWLFPEMTPVIGHAAWLAPALAAAGTLFVIPTAGEVPIIQILQQFGLGGAGAAALLMTLPAVSLPSLAMLARALPMRGILVLACGTFVFGLLAAGAAVALGFG